MDRQSLKTTLEVSTNVAVVLVAISLLSLLAIFAFVKPPKPELSPGLERGRVLTNLSNVDFHASDQTLLIALSTTCSYCRESLPLYRQILKDNHDVNSNLAVVALFPNSPAEVENYLKDNDLPIDVRTGVNFESIHIAGTPTVILVNSEGVIKNFWTGKLETLEADELVRSLISKKERSN